MSTAMSFNYQFEQLWPACRLFYRHSAASRERCYELLWKVVRWPNEPG